MTAEQLPERVTIYEVGPRDGLQNEKALVPADVKDGVRTPAARRRAAGRRGDQLRAPEVGAAAGRRRGADDPPRRRTGATCRCWSPTSAASTGRSSSGCGTSRSSARRPRRSRRRTSTAASTSSSPCSSRRRRARDAGLDVRAYVSMCFGDPWEGEVPVEQVVSVGKRLFDLGASQLSLGDTIGVGTAGHVTR